jgi:DNA repair protein SbcC/Rad50
VGQEGSLAIWETGETDTVYKRGRVMLESIHIKNFQSHKDTKLELHLGINAIIGTSDTGKSSILRAIKFLSSNRPRGTAFISHGKDESEVQLKFDGTTITRKRGKKTNSYELGNQSFDVVKSDVPEEITQFLNFSDTTIQSQHDKYFLLQDTAGEVAKKLNKVADLDIIDYVMKEVNSAVSENKRNIKYTQERIDELETGIDEYEHLKKAEVLLSNLTKRTNQHTELANLQWEINGACEKIKSTEETIKILDDWLKIEESFIGIIRSCKELRDLLVKEQNLENIIKEIEDSKRRVKKLSGRAEGEETVEVILRYTEERERLVRDLIHIEEVIYSTELENEVITEKGLDIEDLTKVAVNLIQENKLCPLCGGEIGENVLDHVREWL